MNKRTFHCFSLYVTTVHNIGGMLFVPMMARVLSIIEIILSLAVSPFLNIMRVIITCKHNFYLKPVFNKYPTIVYIFVTLLLQPIGLLLKYKLIRLRILFH